MFPPHCGSLVKPASVLSRKQHGNPIWFGWKASTSPVHWSGLKGSLLHAWLRLGLHKKATWVVVKSNHQLVVEQNWCSVRTVFPSRTHRVLHMTMCHRQAPGKSTPQSPCRPCYPHCPGGGVAAASVFRLFVGSSGSWFGLFKSPWSWFFCSSVSEIPRLCTKDSTAMGICSGSAEPGVSCSESG